MLAPNMGKEFKVKKRLKVKKISLKSIALSVQQHKNEALGTKAAQVKMVKTVMKYLSQKKLRQSWLHQKRLQQRKHSKKSGEKTVVKTLRGFPEKKPQDFSSFIVKKIKRKIDSLKNFLSADGF